MFPTQAQMSAVSFTLRINMFYKCKTQTQGVGVSTSEYKQNII